MIIFFLTIYFYFGICPPENPPVDDIAFVEIGKTLIMPAHYNELKTTFPDMN